METLKEPVSVRISRINADIVGRTKHFEKSRLLSRECLLDAVQVLYDECSSENLQKCDLNIASFVKKYKNAVDNIKSLRVNISDFEIKNIIGCGHFGEVHVVKEKQTGDVYAMKTIRKFDDQTKRMSFEEERNIMAFSNSPWVTSLQYAFQDSSYLFFVMDYHPGGDLLGLLYRQGGTLPESAAIFYVSELILALEDLHKMGYVHRDIKPDNILLDRCGHLKLADFGSAAKLDRDGLVKMGPPVGTPDYIAPEVLQCLDNKNNKGASYGISCDFWSMGILAYELTIGHPPFQGQNSSEVYSKIINHQNNLKFPSDVVLSQGYVNFVKGLVTDYKSRLKSEKIKNHPLFETTNFETLRDQVPPFVPKIVSLEDTSNFTDVQAKKKNPSIENFKKRSQFSGRNLPFIGFTFTHDPNNSFEVSFQKSAQKNTQMENMKTELDSLRMRVSKIGDVNEEKQVLQKKLEEKTRRLESIEVLRDKLERDLSCNIAECTALKRTLDLERKDRAELERKALELIKGAKLKWELAEKSKIETLALEIKQQKEKIVQLTNTNRTLEEQLQHALKVQEQNRQSLETVESLNRKSVIGLENRLEKITSESQQIISELQSKLGDKTHQNVSFENQVLNLKTREYELKGQLNISERNYNDLKLKVNEAEVVIKELNNKVDELEKDIEKNDYCKNEMEALQNRFEQSQKVIKDLQNKNLFLQNECKQLDDYKKEIDVLKQKILTMKNDKRVSILEKELEQEKNHCQSLKKRLAETESAVTQSQELREKQLQFWKMEKELSNCKIDKRILERELKDAQAEIKNLNDKLSQAEIKQNEFKKCQEEALLELSHINENISVELIKSRENNKMLQEQLQNEKEKNQHEKTLVKELNLTIATRDEKIRNLEKEIISIKKDVTVFEQKCKKEEQEKSKMIELVEELTKEKARQRDEIEKAKREIQTTNLNFGALREACVLLESQVIEYEKLLESGKKKEAELNANTEKLIADLCQSRIQTQEAKRQINEQKSLKAVCEQKIKRLEEDKECLEKECQDYKLQCMEYKQFSAGLSDQLTTVEEKLGSGELKLKSYERQIEKLSTENKRLKEETSDYLTNVVRLKESNYKLGHQINDLNKNNEGLVQKIRELERILNEKCGFYKERELKAESTIKQQTKLIDFLQTKIDEQSHKKKKFTEIIFGSSKKENQPPPLVMNYKDLENELVKEREQNKQLKEEVYKLKAASLSEVNFNISEKFVKMGKSQSEISTAKGKQTKGDIEKQHSVQIRQHRFETKICKSPQRCEQCNHQVSTGKNYHVCKDCKLVAHNNCSSAVQKTCCLPKTNNVQYACNLENDNPDGRKVDRAELQDALCEGWVKIPCFKSCTWEKRYAYLTKCSLDIYTKPPKESTSALLDSFPLNPKDNNGKVTLEPVSSEIGIPVAVEDLPFIIKVEVRPETTCWPSKCIILMALSAKEKDAWFAALLDIIPNKINSQLEIVVKVPEDVVVNCLIDLTEKMKILGTNKGLYSHYENKLLRLEGIDNIEQIVTFPPANLVLIIGGPKSSLMSCDVNYLINLIQNGSSIKHSLKYKPINVKNLDGFNIVKGSDNLSQTKIAVATPKQLIILEYHFDSSEFIPLRILDTAQPTSCMLFTENSLIVGADKFFEIDLDSYKTEEFLDPSDAKLKPVLECHKMGSFPISILQISKNPKEYLLSFNELSMFVDEYGRASRQKEMKSNHFPFALHLVKNYLYIVQFATIEIVKVTEDTCNGGAEDCYKIQISRFRYVGANSSGIYISQNSEIKYLSVRNLSDFDAVSVVSDSSDVENESNNSGFSFTSSMVQSLDGNLSDTTNSESIGTVKRKVKFKQTDF